MRTARRTVLLLDVAGCRAVGRICVLMVGAVRESGSVWRGSVESGGVMIGIHLLLNRLLVYVSVDADGGGGRCSRVHVLVMVDVATERS